jgi:hypothetical protein
MLWSSLVTFNITILYAVLVDGMLASVQFECAASDILAGKSPLVLQANADNQTAASSTPLSLQRILDAMKGYDETWGCRAKTDKSHVFLGGPPDAAAEAQRPPSKWLTDFGT